MCISVSVYMCVCSSSRTIEGELVGASTMSCDVCGLIPTIDKFLTYWPFCRSSLNFALLTLRTKSDISFFTFSFRFFGRTIIRLNRLVSSSTK